MQFCLNGHWMNPLTKTDKKESFRKAERAILIVDDEPLVCWSLKNALERAGFEVTTTESGEAAIQLLKDSFFDLIITDMNLPSRDGFEVARAGMGGPKQVPVIMVTAYGDESARERAERMGVSYVVDKPFDLSEMVNLARQLICS